PLRNDSASDGLWSATLDVGSDGEKRARSEARLHRLQDQPRALEFSWTPAQRRPIPDQAGFRFQDRAAGYRLEAVLAQGHATGRDIGNEICIAQTRGGFKCSAALGQRKVV